MLALVNKPAAAAAIVMIVAGGVLSAVGDPPDAAGLAGFLLLGLGGILAVALAFYAVGRSEDLEREREQRRRPGGP
jgi:uncharacterized membrane protein YccC